MCKCSHEIRTPYCGKFGCVWPKKVTFNYSSLSKSAWCYLKDIPPRNEEEAGVKKALEEIILKLDNLYEVRKL